MLKYIHIYVSSILEWWCSQNDNVVAGKFSKIKLLKKDTISSPLDFRHTLTVRPSEDESSVKQLVAVAKDTPPGSPAIMRAIARQ